MTFSLLSFWEREQYLSGIDVIIAGSGIVGINAALVLKQKNPKLNILIAERGALPSGASTKNAGFACFGSLTELIDDLKTMTEDEVLALVEKRFRGLKRLREIVGDKNMNLEMNGGYEVFNTTGEYGECEERMDWFNSRISPIVGMSPVYVNADSKISEFGLGGIRHMILNRGEGQIDSGRMMSALIAKAQEAGIRIMNGLEIQSLESSPQGVHLHTANGYKIETGKLIICTNGFAKQLLPEEDVEPARAQVLITNEIPDLKLKGTFHYDKGYYYFRNVGNRVLFGGGRNLDFKGENTTAHQLTEKIQSRLDELLRTMILPGVNYSVDMRWAGTMGVGGKKSPIVKQLSPNVYCAVRMGGMGVALGSLVGEEVAGLI